MRFPTWRPTWRFVSICRSINQLVFYSVNNYSSCSEMDHDVVHDISNNEFFISLGKERAILQYQILENKVIDMYHTEVPESQRGKGIAGHLVKAALSYVVDKNLKIQPTCSYVQHYINKNQSHDIIERVLQK